VIKWKTKKNVVQLKKKIQKRKKESSKRFGASFSAAIATDSFFYLI
jgi:hypothetical protein